MEIQFLSKCAKIKNHCCNFSNFIRFTYSTLAFKMGETIHRSKAAVQQQQQEKNPSQYCQWPSLGRKPSLVAP